MSPSRSSGRKAAVAPRAPRSTGPRTTVRVPAPVAEVAAQLARDLEISRNDALLRLAGRGAELYEWERAIADRGERRWAAVVPGLSTVEPADLPSPDEAREAALAARDDGAAGPA